MARSVDIPYRGDTWRIYVKLFARTPGKGPGVWARWFREDLLRGDERLIHPRMLADAEEARAAHLRRAPLPDWLERPAPLEVVSSESFEGRGP